MKNNGEIIEFLKQKNYEMINNKLGSGAFGKTVLIKDPFIDELFVAKKYEPEDEDNKKKFYELFLQEIKIMYKLYHKNIVRIFSYYAYEDSYTGYIIMEYIRGKSLYNHLDNYCPPFDDCGPDEIFVQLIDAFQYIEEKGIVHRDLRESNILVTDDGVVKVIDFGLGKQFNSDDFSDDSMTDYINRSGLDAIPNEYREGKYDSLTDMFYLAELLNRIIKQTHNEDYFSYFEILKKMMSVDRDDRFSSFVEVKKAIEHTKFSQLPITDKDKEIYQQFSISIQTSIIEYKKEPVFRTDFNEFVDKLKIIMQKNCFEDYIQNVSDLIRTIVISGYTYSSAKRIECSTVETFYNWFCSLSVEAKNLVYSNIIYKISNVPIDYSEDLPF